MSQKQAGGIFASSFIAGLLLAAAIFAPRAWEPVPGPFFGLDEPAPIATTGQPATEPAIEARQTAGTVAVTSVGENVVESPVAVVVAEPTPQRMSVELPSTGVTEAVVTEAVITEAVVTEAVITAAPLSLPTLPETRSPPPERVAVADASSPAAMAALADTLPRGPDTSKAMVTQIQASQPAAPLPPRPAAQSWSQSLAQHPAATVVVPRNKAPTLGPPAGQSGPLTSPVLPGVIGPPPLPGEPWTDPDGANWSDAITVIAPPAPETDRRRNWLGDWRNDSRIAEPRAATTPPGGRLFERLRGGDRRLAHLPGAANHGTSIPLADTLPPDISQWPHPVKLEQQLEHLATLAAPGGPHGEPISRWILQTRSALDGVQETRGPRDAAADASLITLGETVLSGMSLADTTVDSSLATHTRRAALAVARRVAVWRSTTAFFATFKQKSEGLTANDTAAAMTAQATGRTVVEVARLLDGIERFEAATTMADALIVKNSLSIICGFYPSAARGLARAVEDHYIAPNVRVAVHQQLLEKLLPGATVDTGPFQETVMGRDVRGTRRVERTTTLRLVPDEDEICFNLEVHGDIASRATTDAGAVSVTARSASAFTVRKPIKISSAGLLFGSAAGQASNRSRVDTIQTSFDAMPVMGSLVRNMARNQQAEAMPEANREVIDKIVSRACREVDTQSEPQFAQMADRVRSRFWLPLVRLGLEPKPIAMQTTSAMATMRLRLAADTQLAAHTPRPRAPADAMLSLQVHESSANNALDQLELAGRQFTLEELIQRVCLQIGVEPRIPAELPEDVTVTFAKTQPLRVECRDGLVHVHIALDAIESGRRDWYDLVVRVAYRPICQGQQVFLEREGPVQLGGPGREGRMEVALRTIFGKVFPKERPIAVLPEQIANNPRLTDVQAVSAVSSDGWLALTLENRPQPPATPVAAPARAADGRRKLLFR